MNRDLAAACSENEAADSDDIADIPLLILLENVSADLVDLDVALYPSLAVKDIYTSMK